MGLIIESIKTAIKTWKKGWLSFVLIVIILSITFIPLILVSYIYLHYAQDIIGFLLFFLMVISFLIFYSLLQGIVQAIGNEILEIEQGRAENIIYYIR
ncbi:MAG: hypothetical protein ACFFCM_20485, partial [Promethearchaeota archaeon]